MKQQDAWPKSQRYFFSAREHRKLPGAFLQGESVILSAQVSPQEKKELYDLTGSAVSGQPNLQNSMAAILTARLLGCPQERILESLRKFAPLPHRMTLIAEIDGVKYIDDSKATNIGAVHASLTAMGQKILLIAGGRDKGGDYALLADIVQEKVKFLILIGEARAKMAEAFRMKTRVEPAESLEEAVYLASNAAEPGDVVLLSPACSSFDMFSSYSERGDVFARSVLAMRNTMQH
jgi:UDP-N-acetylmuramoylalanine--D-glutamate ligase